MANLGAANLVLAEMQAVLAAMRCNVRWSLDRAYFKHPNGPPKEHHLIADFEATRHAIHALQEIDPNVKSSQGASGGMTSGPEVRPRGSVETHSATSTPRPHSNSNASHSDRHPISSGISVGSSSGDHVGDEGVATSGSVPVGSGSGAGGVSGGEVGELPLSFLAPFLAVVRSEETSGPVTDAALMSLCRFLDAGLLVGPDDVLSPAIHDVAAAIRHCRFPETDPATDEVVLMRLLQVLLALVRAPASRLLSNAAVSELVIDTCYRIRCWTRLSELLRRHAEHVIASMVSQLFSQFRATVLAGGPVGVLHDDSDATGGVANIAISSPSIIVHPIEGAKDGADGEGSGERRDGNGKGGAADEDNDEDDEADEEEEAEDSEPFGEAAIVNLLHWMATLIEPPAVDGGVSAVAEAEADKKRLLGIQVMRAAIDALGEAGANVPDVRDVLKDDAARVLIMTAGSTSNLMVLQGCLSAMHSLLVAIPRSMKLQTEYYVCGVILRLAESPSTSFDMKERVLLALVEITRHPRIIPEIYLNYDCDLHRANVFSRLTRFLYKNAYPVTGALTSLHLLSLQGLISVVDGIAARIARAPAGLDGSGGDGLAGEAGVEGSQDPGATGEGRDDAEAPGPGATLRMTAERLKQRQEDKRRLADGAAALNEKWKTGLIRCEELGLLPPKDSEKYAVELARLLRTTPGIKKTLIGDYIGGSAETNRAVLVAFMETFDFGGLDFESAFRMLLESFRIPGESQQIERIVEAFAAVYYVANEPSEVFREQDAVFTLSYSVLMLNTDAHNVGVRNKMSLEGFMRNNKGLNGGQNYPEEFLTGLYRSITAHEIVFPEDDPLSRPVTASTWYDLVRRGASIEFVPITTAELATIVDRDMFASIWGASGAALSAVFERARSEGVMLRALDGLQTAAEIAARYNMHVVFDAIVIALAKATGLTETTGPSTDTDVLVGFGSSHRAHVACQALFDVVRRSGDHLREGWTNVVDVILRMHRLRLLPAAVVPVHPVLNATNLLPRPKPVKVEQSRMSMLSALGSYLGSGSGSASNTTGRDGRNPTPGDLEAQERAKAVVVECRVEDLLSGTRGMAPDSLVYLVRAVILAARRGSPEGAGSGSGIASLGAGLMASITAGISESGGSLGSSADSSGAGGSGDGDGLGSWAVSAEASMFCLDLLVTVTLHNRERGIFLWPVVVDHLGSVLRESKTLSQYTGAVVIALFRLVVELVSQPEIGDDVLSALGLVLELPEAVTGPLSSVYGAAAKALVSALRPGTVRSLRGWQHVFALLQATTKHRGSIGGGFTAASKLVTGTEAGPLLSAMTFNMAVETVMCFALSPARPVVGAADGGASAGSGDDGGFVTVAFAPETSLACIDVLVRMRGLVVSCGGGWNETWRPLLLALGRMAREPGKDVRRGALDAIQGLLTGPDSDEALQSVDWTGVFDQVVFPLLSDLVKVPPAYAWLAQEARSGALNEARNKGLTMMVKVYLVALPGLAGWNGFGALWARVLTMMQHYVVSEPRDPMLLEGVPEMVKNLVLVMHSSEMLVPGSELWKFTWEVLDNMIPGLRENMFPNGEAPAAGSDVQTGVDGSGGDQHQQQEAAAVTGGEAGGGEGGVEEEGGEVGGEVGGEPSGQSEQVLQPVQPVQIPAPLVQQGSGPPTPISVPVYAPPPPLPVGSPTPSDK